MTQTPENSTGIGNCALPMGERPPGSQINCNRERTIMDLLRKSAGYRYLDAFILANIVELGTGHLCKRFLNLENDPGGRYCSQMTHQAPWPNDSREAKWVYAIRLDRPEYGNDINRGVCLHVLTQYQNFAEVLSSNDSIVRANAMLVLINRTLNIFSRYLKKITNEFEENGGFREQMTTVRSETRASQENRPEEGPACPDCGTTTVLRRTRKDNRPSWGCSESPACPGIVNCS